MNKDFLLKVESCTKNVFAEYRNGEVKFISSGKVIPIDLMINHKLPNVEGFLLVRELTCSGSCEIGKPQRDCYCYINKSCAVYCFSPIENARINIKEVYDILVEGCSNSIL